MDVYVLCTNDCVCNACLSEFQSWASLVTFAIEKGFAGRSADVTRLMSRSLAVPGATWKNASLLIFPPLVASQDPKVPALFRRGDQGHSAGRPSPLQRGRVTIGHSIPPSAVGVMHARRARPPHSAYPLFFPAPNFISTSLVSSLLPSFLASFGVAADACMFYTHCRSVAR